MNWRDFWNGSHAIYVSERHKRLHYDQIAKDITAFVPFADALVLDHGCGEALSADLIAAKCGLLYLYDTAPSVQGTLRLRFSHNDRIVVLSTTALEAMTDGTLDLIVVTSLLQYLSHEEFEGLLGLWHAKLADGGRLVLADVIGQDEDAIADAKALLHFAWQGGFVFAALSGLVNTFFSSYRQLRQEIGLTRYDDDDMLMLLKVHGFAGERSPSNIGHNPTRMTFVARKHQS